MKRIVQWARQGFLAALLSVMAASLLAQDLTRYRAQTTGSKMKIDGDSTTHKWSVECLIVGGFLELDPAFSADPLKAAPGKVNAKASVIVPVLQLKSEKKAMDDVMHEALKAQQFPRIEYRLTELVLKETPKSADAPVQLASKGDLAVAGVTNQISMPVTLTRVDKNKLKASGSVPLKMSSFKIKRPGLLGIVSADDDIVVSFDWLTAAPTEAK